MLLDQNNKCAICNRDFTIKVKPVIDHCHNNGHTRGILCHNCNISLGHVEKPDFLEKALAYLKKTTHL